MHRLWDRLGMSLSFLCLIHCLILPLLVLLLPAFTSFLRGHEYIHIIFAILIWPTALMAFIPAYKHHQKKSILALAFIGLSLITLALFAHDIFGHTIEVIINVIGSLFLIIAHYRNYICNRCQTCHGEHGLEHNHP